MAGGTRKRLPVSSDEEDNVSSKKLKLARRSNRSSKGTGGAVDQLKKVGDAVLTGKKSRPDRLAALGETLNPMAPPEANTGTSTSRTYPPSQPPHLNGATGRPGKRFGFRLPASDDSSPATQPELELPSLARGLKIIADARQRQLELRQSKSTNTKASTVPCEDTDTENHRRADNECLPGDEDENDENEEVLPDTSWKAKYLSDEDLSNNESDMGEKAMEGNNRNMEVRRDAVPDDEQEVGIDAVPDDGQPRNGKDINVLEDYYARNRRPRPPAPTRLRHLQAPAVPNQQNHNAASDADESDDDQPSRRKRYSGASKQDRCTDPSQLGFYPAKWKDLLEECKVETRSYAAVRDPWPRSKPAMDGFISEAIDMTMRRWRREGRTVEKHYYPRYRRYMCKLLFEDLASWRGEFKKVAASLVRSRYDIFPPLGSRLSKIETRQHVKRAAEALIKKSAFAHGGKDNEGHTNNFGHSTIRELIHIFFFGRDNRIGNLRPGEFGTRIPNSTLTFAATAIRCILDGYKLNGKAKFPYFSGEGYRSKWRKYNDLITQLEGNDVHRRKLEQMCCEIARTGAAGSGGAGIDSDENTSDEDYGVHID